MTAMIVMIVVFLTSKAVGHETRFEFGAHIADKLHEAFKEPRARPGHAPLTTRRTPLCALAETRDCAAREARLP